MGGGERADCGAALRTMLDANTEKLHLHRAVPSLRVRLHVDVA